MTAHQLNDEDISKVIQYLKNSTTFTKEHILQTYCCYIDKLELKGQLLVFNHNRRSYCIVVPKNKTKEVMKLCHSDWTTGHFGLFKSQMHSIEFLVAYLLTGFKTIHC